MRKISGSFIALLLFVAVSASVVSAETITETRKVARVSDTPSKYGPKGLYTLFSPDTYQKGNYGIGFYWDLTNSAVPGDPREPTLMEFTVGGAYGITDKLEVSAALPFRTIKLAARDASPNRFAEDEANDDVDESGLGNLSLGVRYTLWENEGATAGVTPFVQAFLPTSSDPEKGTGADNTRVLVGVSAGTTLAMLHNTRLYGQLAYQFATDYDQDRRDFTENIATMTRPRFDYFGTNPLFHEYGNTLLYGAGFAIPLVENKAELFSEFTFFNSLDDEDYIPMYEDGQELDVVQSGGMGVGGLKIGFDNGLALTAGAGGYLFGKEPLYHNPHLKVFAGLTYNKPETVIVQIDLGEVPPSVQPGGVQAPLQPFRPVGGQLQFDCRQELAMVHFEFDKSTLTPEAIATLQRIGKYLRLCTEAQLIVQGHTDWMGTENYNMGLGNRRARAVVYYLVYDEGIDPARIVKADKLAKGIIAGETFGESMPIASNETDAGRALNRRSQFDKVVPDNRLLVQE